MKRYMSLSVMICAVIFVFSPINYAIAYKDHGYPYQELSCRSCPHADVYNFCQNHCTSYAAYMLNQAGVPFSNSYMYVKWSDAGNWDDAARSKGIPVDTTPLPGDVAYWNNKSGYGHVAWVEKVTIRDGKVISIDYTEYNVIPCSFREMKNIAPGSGSDYPDGFIHILAYNEGVTGLYYLDNYEMSSLSDINQTPEEWQWILTKVNQYRCKNCNGDYKVVADAFYADYGMGGGDDPATTLSPKGDANVKEVTGSIQGLDNFQGELVVFPRISTTS